MNYEKAYDLLLDKLADIRELFDETDMKAEGHGMEDAISDPYAVAIYAENKLKRQQQEIEQLKKEKSFHQNRVKYLESMIDNGLGWDDVKTE